MRRRPEPLPRAASDTQVVSHARYRPAHAHGTPRGNGRLTRPRLLVALGLLVTAMAASGAAAYLVTTGHTGGGPSLPYPLGVPVGRRTPAQLAEGRLMLAPHLSAAGGLAPLPPALRGTVTNPSDIAEIRLSQSIDTLTWTTGTSWGDTIASVYSKSPTLRSYRLAMRSGARCFFVSYDAGTVRYAVTDGPRACSAAADPASGWSSSWPRE